MYFVTKKCKGASFTTCHDVPSWRKTEYN